MRLNSLLKLPVLLFAFSVTTGFQSSSLARAANRTSDEIGNDLVLTLSEGGRLEDAEWLCRRSIQSSPPGQLSHAKWTARLAIVLARRGASSLFDGKASDLQARIEPAIQSSCQPIDELLTSYPDSPSTEFLAATKLVVRQRVLSAAIVAAAVSPLNEQLVNELLSRVSRLQDDTTELKKAARERWSERNALPRSRSSDLESISADQYNRLVQELSVQRVSLAVLQTELFGPSTADYRSAAAAAVMLAEQAVLALPDAVPAKRAARALLAESLLRSGDYAAAGELIRKVRSEPSVQRSPVWTALQVRYELAAGNRSEANRICESFYGSPNSTSGQETPPSLEMDFAKLDVLLSDAGADSEIATWLDFIQGRGGAFARRRAEAIAIRELRRGASSMAGPSGRQINPSLIAAQGEDWLRRDDPSRAATLLREAALAEPQAEIAFGYAIKSAASATAAADFGEAISVLRDTARKHPAAEEAAGLMMQAALLASKPFRPVDDPKSRLGLLEELLREMSQTWPASEIAVQANAWLCRILSQTDRQEEAARASLELLTLGQRTDLLEPTATHWFGYVTELDPTAATTQLTSLAAALHELAEENDQFEEPIRRVSVWLFDRDQLTERSSSLDAQGKASEFLKQLARFRFTGQGTIETAGVAAPILERSRWRLQRDATLEASLQRPVGVVLAEWPDSSEWQKAMAQLWSAQDDISIARIKRLALAGNGKSQSLRRGMELLAASQSASAKRNAVELSDRLAGTMPIASPNWYSVKLQAIGWLSSSGQLDESQKRARYVLLLHPPVDAGLRMQFERAANRNRP